MGVNRAIVVVSLGDRQELVKDLLDNLRAKCALPIVVVTDVEQRYVHELQSRSTNVVEIVRVERSSLQWLDSPRWGVRNCNALSAKFALCLPYDSCCVLNDDMRIAHPGFVDGFVLAERFGVCVPMNPRVYIKYNAMGADMEKTPYNSQYEGPEHATACNVSPMFVCRHHDNATALLNAYLEELQVCMRGTHAFWRASWRTGVTPVYLPEQWCVCGSNAKYIHAYKKTLKGKSVSIEPMMLHWGQAEVRETFKP